MIASNNKQLVVVPLSDISSYHIRLANVKKKIIFVFPLVNLKCAMTAKEIINDYYFDESMMI